MITKELALFPRLPEISKHTGVFVRKWIRRHQEEGKKGLCNLSSSPKHPANRLSSQIENLILKIRDTSEFGPKRIHSWLKRNLEIEVSISTIAKYLKKHKKTKKKLKRLRPKIFDWKSLPVFSISQIDTKEILDAKVFSQEEREHYLSLGLPLYQFTVIFPKIRARFLSFAKQGTRKAALNFAEYVFDHLASYNITPGEPKTFYVQSDWGSEYGGYQTRGLKRYDEQLAKLSITHFHSRKSTPTDNSFVERSHRTDDEEFYRLEKNHFKDLKDFLKKSAEWVYYYNFDRTHDGLDGKTPVEALKTLYPEIPSQILFLPPVVLDDKITLLGGGIEVYRYYILELA